MEDSKTIFTKEMKARLAGYLPMQKNAIHKFTPDIYKDIPEEYRPVFYIRQFTRQEISEIKILISEATKQLKSKSTSQSKSNEKSNKRHRELSYSVLTGWENLYDIETLLPIEYSEENKELFTDNMISDISIEAVRISGFLPTA